MKERDTVKINPYADVVRYRGKAYHIAELSRDYISIHIGLRKAMWVPRTELELRSWPGPSWTRIGA